jgi:hypothetical protein
MECNVQRRPVPHSTSILFKMTVSWDEYIS